MNEEDVPQNEVRELLEKHVPVTNVLSQDEMIDIHRRQQSSRRKGRNQALGNHEVTK